MLMRWHWPPENSLGRRPPATAGSSPTASSIVADGVGPFRPRAAAPDVERLGDDVADPAARVERGDRVLEDHLDRHPGLARSRRRSQRGEVDAVEDHRARPPAARPGRSPAPALDFPQPDSPTRPSVSPARTSRSHAGHRLDLAAAAAVLDPEATDRRGASRHSRHLPPAAGPAPAQPQREPAARTGGPASRPSTSGGASRAAQVLGVRAARGERAAGGPVDQVGRPALDGRQPGVARVGQPGRRAEQRLRVRHARSTRTASAVGACSTTRPAYMTRISSARVATTPRSWETRTIAMRRSALQRGQQVEDLGLHRDVEPGRRLVGQQQPGRAGDGDGDRHPLAHPARQLARVAAVPALRRGDADLPEQRDRPSALASARSISRCRRSDSVIWRPIRTTGFSDVIGSWKTMAMLGTPQRPEQLRRGPHELPALEPHRPRLPHAVAPEQPHHRPRQDRLAGAGLARRCPASGRGPG